MLLVHKKLQKNAGINIKATGIKNSKFTSNDNEIVIQYKFVKKYPKPKNQPYKNDLLLSPDIFFLKKKIKIKVNVA